jgi:hypothetical protein
MELGLPSFGMLVVFAVGFVSCASTGLIAGTATANSTVRAAMEEFSFIVNVSPGNQFAIESTAMCARCRQANRDGKPKHV